MHGLRGNSRWKRAWSRGPGRSAAMACDETERGEQGPDVIDALVTRSDERLRDVPDSARFSE